MTCLDLTSFLHLTTALLVNSTLTLLAYYPLKGVVSRKVDSSKLEGKNELPGTRFLHCAACRIL